MKRSAYYRLLPLIHGYQEWDTGIVYNTHACMRNNLRNIGDSGADGNTRIPEY